MSLKKYLLAGGLSTILILGACDEGTTTDEGAEDDTEETSVDTETEGEDGAEESTTEEDEENTEEAAAEDTSEEEETEDTQDVIDEETEVAEENLSLGDTVELEGVTVTIENAYYTDERNEFADVEADSVLIVDVYFENNTGEDYSPAFDFDVYADGSKAETYPVGDIILDSVSDGRNSSGSIAYALVGEPEEIELEFSPLFSFSGEKAIYNITPQ